MKRPETVSDWALYFASLPAEVLVGKTRACNTMKFIDGLESDGLSASEIATVFDHVARRFLDTGEVPPTGGVFNIQELMSGDGVANLSAPIPGPYMEPPDEIDTFMAAAEAEA